MHIFPSKKKPAANRLPAYLALLLALSPLSAFAETERPANYNQDLLVKEFFSIATGKPLLSSKKLIKKYPFSCDKKQSFSDIKLKKGAQECSIDNIKTYPGVPLLILGIEENRIVAFVYYDETDNSPLPKEYQTECSNSDIRLPICYTKGATKKQKRYWFKIWDQRLKAAS